MTATATHTIKAARRYPLPWEATQPTPMLSPSVIHRPAARYLDLTLTSRFAVDAPGNTLEQARLHATCLTAAELQTALHLPRMALKELSAGRGTREHWISLCSALNVAMAIESGGVVRGLSQHFNQIEQTLNAIGNRASSDTRLQGWTAPALWATEMDALRLLVDLHAHQLKHLSYGEYQAAYRLAVARVQSGGGEVVKAYALKGLAA